MAKRVNKILIPNKPQLDPIVALYLLLHYGENKFHGIGEAKIIYWQNSADPTKEEMDKFYDEGVLMVDVGGGIFDHHNKSESNNTATSLVASYLGIENNSELSALLSYVQEDDLEGLHNRFGDLAYVIKCMHKQNMESNQVMQYALNLIHTLQEVQKDWHLNVKKEFENKCQIVPVKRFNRKLKVGIIESDELQVANYGITVKNLSIVIQKRSSGHIMILTNKNHRIDLREIVVAIRKRELELELKGYEKPIDLVKLRFDGKNNFIPNWFYHRSLNAFLNGSDALAKAEATKVPLDEIIRFVIYGLTTEESELCDCAKGGNTCPYRAYGFSKCKNKQRYGHHIMKARLETIKN